jgi:hypothetical protein
VAGPYRRSKPMFTCLSNSLCIVPATSHDIVYVSKAGPMIAVELQQLTV